MVINNDINDHATYAAEMDVEVYRCNLGSLKGCSADPALGHDWRQDLEDEIGRPSTDEDWIEWLSSYALAKSTLVEEEEGMS